MHRFLARKVHEPGEGRSKQESMGSRTGGTMPWGGAVGVLESQGMTLTQRGEGQWGGASEAFAEEVRLRIDSKGRWGLARCGSAADCCVLGTRSSLVSMRKQ